jgi:transcription antitermination protein NusB
MASKRHLLRSVVVQTLFAWEFHGGDPHAILSYNLVNGGQSGGDSSFAVNLLEKTLENQMEIRKAVARFAPEWPWEKIAPIDRAILELALAELLSPEDIPPLVAINEAIELAKEFGNENASKFVNGVLSSFYDDFKKQESR